MYVIRRTIVVVRRLAPVGDAAPVYVSPWPDRIALFTGLAVIGIAGYMLFAFVSAPPFALAISAVVFGCFAYTFATYFPAITALLWLAAFAIAGWMQLPSAAKTQLTPAVISRMV